MSVWDIFQDDIFEARNGTPIIYIVVAANDNSRRWETQDGRSIRYEDLTDEHLANIMNMLYRHGMHEYWPNLCDHWDSRLASVLDTSWSLADAEDFEDVG